MTVDTAAGGQHVHDQLAVTSRLSGRRPVGRWLRRLTALTLAAVFVTLLLVQAYTNASFAPDSTAPSGRADTAVPVQVRDGGPAITIGAQRPRTAQPARDRIALTFDDGPDPTWTPRILDLLARHRVQATFFVVGSQAARHPDLVRRIVAEGHEIGVHTFTHPDLTAIGSWRRDLEYSLTQLAIAHATGVKTTLFRPPYSSSPDAVHDADWRVLQDAGRQGYLTVLENADSRDWARPGEAVIAANSTPRSGGAIVLLHDAGGDRAQTLSALQRYIPAMRERGYRFTTVSQSLATPPAAAAHQRAGVADRWRGHVLVWTIAASDAMMSGLWWILIVIGVLTLARTLLMFAVAARAGRRPSWKPGPPVTDPVSIIVPAYNECDTIAATIATLAKSAYPQLEIIVVDDGSTDATAAVVQAMEMDNVRLVRVPNAGKALALNTGLAMARYDLIVMVDADTIVEPDAIARVVEPFADPAVGAVAGNVKVGNRRRLLPRWQHIEYVIGFNLDRRLYDALGCIPTIPGALGAFRRSALADAGGLSVDTLAEDTDLTMAILRQGWRVVYQRHARCHTEAPTTLRQLLMQRYRWSYGTMQSMWKHRRSLAERGASGRFGRRGLPLIAAFSVVLPLFGPILDLLTVYGWFFLDRTSTVIGWLAILAVQIATAILAFRLDKEPLRPLWALPLQQLVYRQLMYAVLLRSATTAIAGRRLRWQKLHRTAEVAARA
ncbi:bifunctional polysaccharide deacetylase/glycosyltransferase family 2 protein [Catellatospora vulcania]|uniref:bifunctional polysaccharide deacetylase/glycosyltransferase family 2 protein n=1 Tax=Catellatospora vulcania TaxID=1460450 RepID=UPI0012D46FC1|nr:glycosyltransferase [Catellatospora vulcania]